MKEQKLVHIVIFKFFEEINKLTITYLYSFQITLSGNV